MLLHAIGVSECLLRVAAQHLQTQSDVVDPTPRVDSEVAAKQSRMKNSESFFVWIVVSCEDLRREEGGNICVKVLQMWILEGIISEKYCLPKCFIPVFHSNESTVCH